jgi:hypothetical protein
MHGLQASFLLKLGFAFVDVVMSVNRLHQIIVDNIPRALRAGTASEQHDAISGVGESTFQKSDSDGKS